MGEELIGDISRDWDDVSDTVKAYQNLCGRIAELLREGNVEDALELAEANEPHPPNCEGEKGD